MIKILILEDNLMIADQISDLLEASGYEVTGIARTVSHAVDLYRARCPDHAIVDIHLADDLLGADLLSQLGEPIAMGILFTSDNASGISLTGEQGTAFIRKPFRAQDLLDALAVVVDIQTKGISLLSYPPGFRLLDVLVA